MQRSAILVLIALAAAALVHAGLYLTGFAAAHVQPRLIGLTAPAVFAPMMLAAWGIPAFALWLAVAWVSRRRVVRDAWLCGALAALVLALRLAFDSAPGDFDTAASVRAFGDILIWPSMALAFLAPLGAWIGGRWRRS